MRSPRWSVNALMQAAKKFDREKAQKVLNGPITAFLRYHLEGVLEIKREHRTWGQVSEILANKFPGLTHADKPIRGLAKELKKAVGREQKRQERIQSDLEVVGIFSERPYARQSTRASSDPELSRFVYEFHESRSTTASVSADQAFEDPERTRLANEIKRRSWKLD